MFDHELREAAEHALAVCRKKGLKVVTAESCTGGLIAAALTAPWRVAHCHDRTPRSPCR